ncbi:MAG TPA: murein biosynthesis integral membrane protein MurJ [Acidimicrobiales bacterium]|nr:murein biosynthesis integral membrane protein MurJ [Acidimicrobiales bacterium]
MFEPLQTRSDFNLSLTGKIDTFPRKRFALGKLTGQGPTTGAYETTIPVNPKTATTQDSLRLFSPGVYPVRVDLYDRLGRSLAQLTTYLVYSPAVGLQGALPLEASLITPVQAPPAIGAEGRSTRLDRGQAQSLAELAGELAAHPEVPVTIAATPQTLDALASGGSADKATVAAVRQLAGGGTAQVVPAPYVRLNLPGLLNAGLDGEVTAQLARGSTALATSLHTNPAPGTWVEQGALSQAAIDGLSARGITRVVVNDADLEPLPASLRNLTLAQPFEVTGKSARRVQAIAADPGLSAHLTPTSDPILAAHQLLADLAMIQQELQHPQRGVAILPPANWRPDREFLATVLNGMANSPLLKPVTVDRLFSDVGPIQQHQQTLRRSVAADQPSSRGISDGVAIQDARRRMQSLSSVVPPGSPITTEIDDALLLAESADLTDRARAVQVDTATKLIARQQGLFHLPANRTITLTARQGQIPITILSSAPYPAKVRVQLSNPKLGFKPVDIAGGSCQIKSNAEICTLDLHSENTTLKVPVEAKTAGVFKLAISLNSADGDLALASGAYTVRSTAASGVGIILSVGAALLLLMWWVRDLRHGRRARRLVPTALPGVEESEAPEPIGPLPVGPLSVGPEPVDLLAVGPLPVGPESVRPPPRDPESGGPSLTSIRSTGSGGRSAVVVVPPPIAPPRAEDADEEALSPPPPPTPPAPAPASDDSLPSSFSRNTAVMAAGTLLSRLTGFGRVIALVWAFHLTRLADVYNIANTVPNLLYDLVLGGVLSATLVPVFVDYLGRKDEEESWRAISAVVTAITVTLAGLTVVFWLIAPALIRFYLMLNHTASAADQRAIGTTLLRLFVPQLFLLGGIAVTTALLNARRHFAVPAFSPVLNNLITIAAIVATRLVASSLGLGDFRHDRAALLLLGLGTTAGYLVQLVVQLPPLFRGRFRLRPVWDLSHPAVRTVLRLSLWTFGAVVMNQIAFNLILVLAGKKAGDVTVFNTAFQFFQLPYAIFAVSIASVITPDLAERWTERDVAGFRRQMASGLRLTLAIMVPAAVGYILLAHPFLELVFRHGSFSAGDAHRIGTVVAFFALGLPGFSVFLLLMRGYQAMQDTRSMFWLYVVENGVTVVLAGALYPVMGVNGLALGWVVAYTIGTVVAFLHLRTRTRGLEGRATASALVRVGLASVAMAAVVWLLRLLIGGGSDVHLTAQVLGGAIVGTAVYLAVSQVLGVTELWSTLQRVRR